MAAISSCALFRVIVVLTVLVGLPPDWSAAWTSGTVGVTASTSPAVLAGHTGTWWKWWKPDPRPKPKGSVAIPGTLLPLGIGLGGLALWYRLRRRLK